MPTIILDTAHYASGVGDWLSDNFEHQFTTRNPVFRHYARRNAIKKGAVYLVQPVFTGRNPTAAGVSNFNSPMSIPADTGQAAVYNFSWYQALTTVNAQEASVAKTEHEMVNLLQERLQQSVASLLEVIGDDLFSTTDATLGKVAGIPYAVQAPTSGTSAFGGIDRVAQSWWRSQVLSSVGTLTLQKLANAYNLGMQQGGRGPDLIVMPPDLFSAFESLIIASTRFTPDEDMVEAGFPGYLFKGATVVFDSRVPAGTIFLLNTNSLYLVKQTDNPSSEPVEFPDRLVSGYKHAWACALVANRMNNQVRMNGVTV